MDGINRSLFSAGIGLSIGGLLAAGAGALELALPIACEPGRDCWIVHHVDRDPGPGVLDHRCGRLTYEGHDGVDIAIANLEVMKKGVSVLAAADGKVRGVRDQEPDQRVEERGKEAIRGRECGNGVTIAHDDGLESQYCHLRRGSILVKPGENVRAGTELGLVGLSGETSFPHLHFTTRRAGKALDPFTGTEAATGSCAAGSTSPGLWSKAAIERLADRPIPITGLGVAPSRPDAAAIRRGELDATSLRPNAEALVVWLQAYKLEAGDLIELLLLDPAGAVVHRGQVTQQRAQALVMLWSGRKRRDELWPSGKWSARATIRRGDIISIEERQITILP